METTAENLQLHEGFNDFSEGSEVTIYMNGQYKVSMYATNVTLNSDKNIITVNGTSTFIHDICSHTITRYENCIPSIHIHIN